MPFLRRSAIEQVGGWDAHNVTEDADLGLRLARAGYRTELIDSVTLEEATARPRAWIRQRSRWQKGYALTWACHMRAPLRMLRDLGAWRFIGVQVLFLGSLGAAALAPFLWSFLTLAVGLGHPTQAYFPAAVFPPLFVFFVVALVLNIVSALIGLQRVGSLRLASWAVGLPIYHAMASISILKAGSELMSSPFLWHKTAHGLTQPDPELRGPRPGPNPD